ncbi:SRPBCC domain-containing protein [Hylemonella sp. W303a]|uniref:SRPBCC domain-containing protein n=1 Tax=Hylemonella sp. W303a TaxID=3389873 RepID=UPI00396B35E3
MQAKPNEIRIVRVYDAPVALVWDVWTDPRHVARWWGPRGFTLTTHHKDFRVGGHWRYTMHGPDGKDWPNYTRYLEIVPNEKMVYDHGASDENAPPLFRVTVFFSELKGPAGSGPAGSKTQMDMTMALATAEAAEQTRQFIKQAGGNSTWDRLAEYLGEHPFQGQAKRAFFISRSFKAPIARVFEMWRDPQHLAKWMAPRGASMTVRGDIAPGKSLYSTMKGEHGTMHGRATYREVSPPITSEVHAEQARIVYEQQFTDEQGQVARHPMAPTWPETLLTTVTFVEEWSNETRVTIEWEPLEASEGEIQTFVDARSGMTAGWTSSLDQFEEALRV